MSEPTDGEIAQFDRLRLKAATLHEVAWCMKVNWYRFTLSLRARECLPCPHHVLRGGVCDPL